MSRPGRIATLAAIAALAVVLILVGRVILRDLPWALEGDLHLGDSERDQRYVIEGRIVREEDGGPCVGAVVRPLWSHKSTTTDADGHYRIALGRDRENRQTMFVIEPPDRPHLRTHSLTLKRKKTNRHDFTLPPGEPIHGRVVDAVTGTPLAGARVRVSRASALETVTDAEGRFALTGVDAERSLILVEAADHPIAWFRDFERDPAGGLRAELAVSPPCAIRGRVLDADTKEGLAGATVEIVLTKPAFTRAPELPAPTPSYVTSGADGSFAFTGLPAFRSLQIGASASGRAPAWSPRSISFRPDHGIGPGEAVDRIHPGGVAEDLEIALHRAGSLRLFLDPSLDAEIEGLADPRLPGLETIEADAAGCVRADRLPAGPHEVWIRREGLALATRTIEVAPGKTTNEKITIPAGASITGRVLDPDGDPVAESDIFAWPAEERLFPWADAQTRSGPGGRFTLTHLEPGAEYVLAAGSYEFAPSARRAVTAGTHDVEFRLRKRGQLRIRIDAKETDIEKLEACVPVPRQICWPHPFREPSPQGLQLYFEDVAPGPYRLDLLDGLRAIPDRIEVPEGRLVEAELRVVPAPAIRAVATYADSAPGVGLHVWLDGIGAERAGGFADTDASGRLVLEDLTPGPYRLCLEGTTHDTTCVSRWFAVDVGDEDVELALDLGPRDVGALELDVVNEVGRALPGAEVELTDATGRSVAIRPPLADAEREHIRRRLGPLRPGGWGPSPEMFFLPPTLGISNYRGILRLGSLAPGPIRAVVRADGRTPVRLEATIEAGRVTRRRVILARP